MWKNYHYSNLILAPLKRFHCIKPYHICFWKYSNMNPQNYHFLVWVFFICSVLKKNIKKIQYYINVIGVCWFFLETTDWNHCQCTWTLCFFNEFKFHLNLFLFIRIFCWLVIILSSTKKSYKYIHLISNFFLNRHF